MMTNPFSNLVNLFYPNLCLLCNSPLVDDERFICLFCHCNIPKTNYHTHKANPARNLFAGYTQLNEATAFLFFEKEGITQKLIHSLKYYGNKALAAYLGQTAAHELKKEGVYASIDTIIPIPLHPKKEKRRGYNQSEWIAQGIASVYGCTIDKKRLKRIADTQSQTLKTIYDRHVNVENIFELTDPEYFYGKHILLIDDVLTTGATVSSCIEALLCVPDIKISIFALSIAREY
jgi:ComF family protein